MKILLIQPRMNKRPMDSSLKIQMSPPLALLTLAKLTPERHEVIIINENVEKLNYDINTDLVGITITVDVMPRACGIAEEFRKRGVPVVAGGIHITCFPYECSHLFDAICVGPAERVWARILQDIEAGRLKKEYQDMHNFCGSEIVPPLYGRFAQKNYLYPNVVLTGRGCPNRCGFCYNSCENRLFVRRPIKDVIEDIKALGTRHILFIDDNFAGDPSYTEELLENIREMKLAWGAAVTTQIIDYPDLLDLMADSGCKSLFIGFESLNKQSLESVGKRNNVDRYEELVEAIHGRNIMINASMVFGLDGDNQETFQYTLDWLIKMRIETLTSHILTPYPGTRLYRSLDEAGRITDNNLERYDTAHVVFQPVGMTASELYNGYLSMYRRFYSFRNIARRLPRCAPQRAPYILFNLFYRKFGRATAALAKMVPMRALGKIAARISYGVNERYAIY